MTAIVDVAELSSWLSENFVCKVCKQESASVTRSNVTGIVSTLEFRCDSCKTLTCLRPKKVSSAPQFGPHRVIDYQLNRLYMLAIQACGGGKKEATRIGAFLGIGSNCLGHQFSQMEQELGQIIEKFSKECLQQNLEMELALSEKDDNGMIVILVCGDGAWRKRSNGLRCDSIGGLHDLIGLHTGKVLAIHIMSTQCRYCDSGIPHEAADCPKNHEGSAKSMEAAGCLVNVKSLYKPGEHYVGLIVQDHDSSTKAACRHSYKEEEEVNGIPWPRFDSGSKRADTGGLQLDHPVIIFRGDKNHAVKNVAKIVYALSRGKGKKDEKPSPGDAMRYKKNLGYAVKQHSDPAQGSLQEFHDAVTNVLEHNFSNHLNCDAKWCKVKVLIDSGADQEAVDKINVEKGYKNKETHEKIYLKMKKSLDLKLTMEWCEDLYHIYSSQFSEALHKAITSVLPKDRCYSKTMVESVRVHLIVAISSRGWEEAYKNLLERMELEMSDALSGYLQQKDRDVQRQREYQRTPEAKRKRAQKNNDKMKAEINKTKKDRRKGRTYKDGGDDDDVDCADPLDTFVAMSQAGNQPVNPTRTAKRKRRAPDELICQNCGERGHGSRRSKKCRMFGECQAIDCLLHEITYVELTQIVVPAQNGIRESNESTTRSSVGNHTES